MCERDDFRKYGFPHPGQFIFVPNQDSEMVWTPDIRAGVDMIDIVDIGDRSCRKIKTLLTSTNGCWARIASMQEGLASRTPVEWTYRVFDQIVKKDSQTLSGEELVRIITQRDFRPYLTLDSTPALDPIKNRKYIRGKE